MEIMKETGVALETWVDGGKYYHRLNLVDSSPHKIPLKRVTEIDSDGVEIVYYYPSMQYIGVVVSDSELPIEKVIEIMSEAKSKPVEWRM